MTALRNKDVANGAGSERRWRSLLALTAALALCAGTAGAAGKPDKAYIESRFHVVWPGFRSPEFSRATGDQLHTEHCRDLRAVPDILRYAHNYPLPIYDLRSTWDVVTELYMEDLAHAVSSLESPANRIGADVWMARLSGGGKVAPRPWRPALGGLVVRDHVLVDGYEHGYKWLNFVRRKEGVSKADADAYLRDKYAPALAKLPDIRRYVLGLTYTPQGATGIWAAPQRWDAVDMIWFDSLEAMTRFLGSIDYQENILRPAEAAVIDQSRSVGFAAEFFDCVPFPPRYEGPKWEEFRPATPGATSGKSP